MERTGGVVLPQELIVRTDNPHIPPAVTALCQERLERRPEHGGFALVLNLHCRAG